MKVAVRYYSRSGNTRAVAEAIAEEAGVPAISVDAPEAAITEPVDVLFIGGALYAYRLDKHLKAFIENLSPKMVKKGVIFSTSAISRHATDLIFFGLRHRGIWAEDEYYYAKSKPTEAQLAEARDFARKYMK